VNWNPTPDPFFKNFFMETIGLEKVLPETMSQGIYEDDHDLHFGKKEIKQLFEVSIKKKSVQEPHAISISPLGDFQLLAGIA
jgi:hypothetical protein